MFTSISHRASSGSVISAILLLCLSSVSLADTWSPIDNAHFPDAMQYYGAQLAVDEVLFLPRGSLRAEPTLLIAVTDGSDGVRLYSFNTDSSTFTFEDEINVEVTDINYPIVWTPAFMDLDFDGSGDESCLVIPTLSDMSNDGSISIVRLTERDSVSGDLLVENDCFLCHFSHGSIYHVTELPSTAVADYAISTQSDNPLTNRIVLASYDSSNEWFEEESNFIIPKIYYGTFHGAAPCRAWVTSVQDFHYGTDFNGPLCYTTNHNGGILIWDPETNSSNDRIVSRIGVSQCGGWGYEEGSVNIGGELGDVHRAVVLEGASSTIQDLDGIQVDNRLLFYSNNTMGLMICDISKPDAPQHIFQWDGDTRPCEESSGSGDWDWHGSGNMDDDTIVQADPGEYAARTFGIGVATFVPEESPPLPTIHVYLAGGIDGLRLFDFSEFLNPFGVEAEGEASFDDFSIDKYDNYIIGSDTLQAYDLQTFSEDGDTWVFTSWRSSTQLEDVGPIGLTVHLDEDVVCD